MKHQERVRPQANTATAVTLDSSQWLVNSGASHHITNILNNPAIHAPYDGTEELIIGDGTGLSISHVSFIKFSRSSSLILNNVLCIHSMSKSIIYISQLCLDNNAIIEFSSSSFSVKNLTSG